MTRSIELRPASLADAELLLRWRNDPGVREASRTTAAVEPAEHESWLHEVIADPDRVLLIAELEGDPIGQVRFDRRTGDEREISVSLAATRRGSGLGTELIRLGTQWLQSEMGPVPVIAEVRDGNDASMRAFRAAGFREAGRSETAGFARLELRGEAASGENS